MVIFAVINNRVAEVNENHSSDTVSITVLRDNVQETIVRNKTPGKPQRFIVTKNGVVLAVGNDGQDSEVIAF